MFSKAISKYIKAPLTISDFINYINNKDEFLLYIEKNKLEVILYINDFTNEPIYLYYKDYDEMMQMNEYCLNLNILDFNHLHAFNIIYDYINILDSKLELIQNNRKILKPILLDKIEIDYSIFQHRKDIN